MQGKSTTACMLQKVIIKVHTGSNHMPMVVPLLLVAPRVVMYSWLLLVDVFKNKWKQTPLRKQEQYRYVYSSYLQRVAIMSSSKLTE